jgi:hypothetical protein
VLLVSVGRILPVERTLQTMADDHRRLALALVESELDRLRALGPEQVRALLPESPIEREMEGIVLAVRVQAEDERLLVLVDARRGRRMLATGGFALAPDGTTHTPH